MSAGIPTIHEVPDSKFSLSGGLEVLTSILMLDAQGFGAVEVLIAPHCYDTNSWVFRSHLNDRLIWSPLTTCEGMLRTHSIPDLQNYQM
jgi:hypothetical protein